MVSEHGQHALCSVSERSTEQSQKLEKSEVRGKTDFLIAQGGLVFKCHLQSVLRAPPCVAHTMIASRAQWCRCYLYQIFMLSRSVAVTGLLLPVMVLSVLPFILFRLLLHPIKAFNLRLKHT